MRKFEGFMRGINLGGWLSQCDETTKAYFDSFITEGDLKRIADMGFDHVRLPVDYMYLEDETGTPLEEGFQYIDRCVAWAKDNALHVLIDLHKTYGYSFDPLDRDMDREAFFHDERLQERFFRLWERIASRYAADAQAGTVAFELLNEIVSLNVVAEWNDVAGRAIKRLRAITPTARIVVGGVCYNSVTSVPLLDPPADENVVYNFHCYEPIVFTHQKAYWVDDMPKDRTVYYPDSLTNYRKMSDCLPPELAGAVNMEGIPEIIDPAFFEKLFACAIEAAEKNNAPLYCGEYGVIDMAPAPDAIRWYADINRVFEKYGIGRAMWTYRKKDYGLMDAHYDGVREELVKVL